MDQSETRMDEEMKEGKGRRIRRWFCSAYGRIGRSWIWFGKRYERNPRILSSMEQAMEIYLRGEPLPVVLNENDALIIVQIFDSIETKANNCQVALFRREIFERSNRDDISLEICSNKSSLNKG